jgi:uncharacterized membrane protein HdeD (DUF308 family)
VAPKHDEAEQRAAYWPVAVIRAIPLAALAVVITFTSNHPPEFGLVVFGIFALVAGILFGLLSWSRLGDSGTRPFLITLAVVTIVAGVIALVFHTGGLPFLLFDFTFFAVLTGALELYSGLRTRKRFVASRDWLTLGGLTVIVGIVFLLIPPGFSQSFKDPDGVTRVLDSSVIVIGILGLYGAIAAVYLLIAGFSAKWGTQSALAVPAEGEQAA